MTREQFEKISKEQCFANALIKFAWEHSDDITYDEVLKDFVKRKVDEGMFLVASHVCDALNEGYSKYGMWRYDYSMGTLETPTPINSIEDIEDLFE